MSPDVVNYFPDSEKIKIIFLIHNAAQGYKQN